MTKRSCAGFPRGGLTPAVVLSSLFLLSCGKDPASPGCPVPPDGTCDYVLEYDTAPILTSMPAPSYPEEARRNGDEGVVWLAIGVGADGRVCGARVVSSDARTLVAAALAAAVQARFVPARCHGCDVAAEVTVPMRFSLH